MDLSSFMEQTPGRHLLRGHWIYSVMAYNFGNIWNAFHGFWVGLEIMSTTNGYPRGPKNFRNTFLHKIDPLNQIIMTLIQGKVRQNIIFGFGQFGIKQTTTKMKFKTILCHAIFRSQASFGLQSLYPFLAFFTIKKYMSTKLMNNLGGFVQSLIAIPPIYNYYSDVSKDQVQQYCSN